MGSRYPAVSRADAISTPMPQKAMGPVSAARAPSARNHLLTKPPVGGMPTRDREARVKHHMVMLYGPPMPRSWDTWVRWV